MEFKDSLNTRNLYTDFGLVIQRGTASFLEFPIRKKSFEHNWREQNGTQYDLSLPKFEDKQIQLTCAIIADDDTDFWQKHKALFNELAKADYQKLFIDDHSKTYDVFYKNTSNWRKKSKRLKEVPKIFVQFNLSLQIKL